MRLLYKKLSLCLSLMLIALSLVSCSGNHQIINYGMEAVIDEKSDDINFSFEKDIDARPKSSIETKKDRDYKFSEKIKEIILTRTREERKVKGIFLPAYVAGSDEKFPGILENIKKSCINAIVVDVKDEVGRITFDMDNDYVRSKKTIEPQIKDIEAFVKVCKGAKLRRCDMKWTVYTVTTSVEAEDYVCAALMELGFEGVEIVDNVPLTEAEAKAQFIDIPLVCDESDTTSQIRCYEELTGDSADESDIEKSVASIREAVSEYADIVISPALVSALTAATILPENSRRLLHL